MKPGTVALALGALLSACGASENASQPVGEGPSTTAPDQSAPAIDQVAPVDHSKPEAWLCRPEVEDACEQVATATAVFADGRLVKDRFVPDPAAPIDCFYVYPTVSRDEAPNSDIVAGPEEKEVARQQLARFGSVCRLYAPVYRQVTLSALRGMLAGEQPASNREMAYADIKAAWEHYLANDNAGRGVVLIGHSQGAGILSRLIAAEIAGKPAQDRLVSAILPGTNLEIPELAPVAVAFPSMGLCTRADEIGCAISFVSFRADVPPPPNSLFGTPNTSTEVVLDTSVACVNPAELDGSGGDLKPIFPVGAVLFDELAPPAPWTTDNQEIETPFVTLPGMLSARCVTRNGFRYLAVTLAADPLDKRTDTIPGDMVRDGKIQPEWGLHLVDMNLALGNLVDIVQRQGAEWKRLHPDKPVTPQ
jgi:hypothetical protein